MDQRNCQRSLENAINHFQTGAATGVSPENPPEENMKQLRRVWSDRPEDAEHRCSVLRGMRAQSMEFSELNVEYGYSYESAAVVSDGTPAPDLVDDIRVYQPSTRPGSPLPHAWIDDEDGNRRPIKDLVAPGRFLLIAGEDGECVVRGGQRAGLRGGPSARRGADRPPRRRPLRPALRVGAPARDPKRRRDPRAAGSIHRLAQRRPRSTIRSVSSPARSARSSLVQSRLGPCRPALG